MSELSNSLLQVLYPNPPLEPGGRIPLMMEFQVNPHLSPFLVSSSKALIWVRQTRAGKIRGVIRPVDTLFDYFVEVVDEVTEKGLKSEWGNVQPLTKEGLQAAIAHVKSYDLDDLEILARPDMNWSNVDPSWKTRKGDMHLAVLGIPLQSAPWVPKNTVLVVPKEREYLGFVLLIEEQLVSVVHNASRALGIARAGVS